MRKKNPHVIHEDLNYLQLIFPSAGQFHREYGLEFHQVV